MTLFRFLPIVLTAVIVSASVCFAKQCQCNDIVKHDNTIKFTLTDISDISVYTKDIERRLPKHRSRSIAFKVKNVSSHPINLRDLEIRYTINDTTKNLRGNVLYSFVPPFKWKHYGKYRRGIQIDIAKLDSLTPDPNTATGNKYIAISFSDACLLPNMSMNFGIIVFSRPPQIIDETNDPSYIPSDTFVVNPKLDLLPNVPEQVVSLLDDEALSIGVDPTNSAQSSVVIQSFSDLEGVFFSRKFIESDGNETIITVNENGDVYAFDSLPILNRKSQLLKYGTSAPQLYKKLSSIDDNTITPVTISVNLSGIAENSPSVITTDTPIDYGLWKDQNFYAIEERKIEISGRTSALINKIIEELQNYPLFHGFNPQFNTDDYHGIVTCRLPVFIINSLSQDTLTALITDCDSVTPKHDLWTAGYRMNVDNLHYQGDSGSGINSAVWKMGYPNFEDQLYLPTANARFSKQYITDSLGAGFASNQHIAYMLSAIRNDRTKKTEPTAPTTYCGTGFAPNSELYLANYTIKYIGDALVTDMLSAPLKWCTDKNVTVINQSWHTVKNYGTIAKGGVSYGYDSENSGNVTFDDQYVDIVASTYPYPTFCQAAGNFDYDTLGNVVNPNEYVNHKGYNTIVVGQDLRDGGMSSSSIYRNPSSTQELPHVTCGVSVSPGTSVFERPDGTSIVTRSGATSMASAMCAGFVASIQSIDTTLLKHSPWAIRALLMSGADNILGSVWSDNSSSDQRDGAGRLNGINSWLSAIAPYSSGVGKEHGFYIGEIASNTSLTKDIPIIVQNPSINNATNNGNLRIALSWIGNINSSNYVSSLSDLDLELLGPDNLVIARSASLVNPVEMITITNAQKGQQYTIRIKTARNVTYRTPFAVAWVNR